MRRTRKVYSPKLVEGEFSEVRPSGADPSTTSSSPDFVWHGPDQDIRGYEQAKQNAALFLAAFPDFHMDVHYMLAEGDKVAAHATVSGTHQGEFAGMPPTGNRVEVTATDILRVEDGKIAEHWGNSDNLGMMQQLGAIPPPPGQPGS